MTEKALPVSLQRRILRPAIRALVRPALSPRRSIAFQRRWTGAIMRTNRAPRGSRVEAVEMNGVPGERVRCGDAASDAAVLYLHGGGYVFGAPAGYRSVTGILARDLGATTYAPDYRLAPEHPFPAALDDAEAVYHWLLTQGIAGGRIVIAGDSAGGGLALALALRLRDADAVSPAGLAVISPWTDLTLSGDSLTSHAGRDPMLRPDFLAHCARLYAGDRVHDPLASPLLGDLAGLPPIAIQVGADEILLDDARRLTERAREGGTTASLTVFADLWHEFQAQASALPEGTAALRMLTDECRGWLGDYRGESE